MAHDMILVTLPFIFLVFGINAYLPNYCTNMSIVFFYQCNQ